MRWERIAFREGPIFERIVDNILKLTAMLAKKDGIYCRSQREGPGVIPRSSEAGCSGRCNQPA
jgi:hypothetical protein